MLAPLLLPSQRTLLLSRPPHAMASPPAALSTKCSLNVVLTSTPAAAGRYHFYHVCVCVCVCLYIYVCMYVCMYVSMYLYIYLSHISVYIYIVYVCISDISDIYVYMYMYVHTDELTQHHISNTSSSLPEHHATRQPRHPPRLMSRYAANS